MLDNMHYIIYKKYFNLHIYIMEENNENLTEIYNDNQDIQDNQDNQDNQDIQDNQDNQDNQEKRTARLELRRTPSKRKKTNYVLTPARKAQLKKNEPSYKK